MTKQKPKNEFGACLWDDLGTPEKLRRKGSVRRIPPAVNAYILAVTFFATLGMKVADFGEGWVALKHPRKGTIVLGVGPRFVPTRFGPLLELPTSYGDTYTSSMSNADFKRVSKGFVSNRPPRI